MTHVPSTTADPVAQAKELLDMGNNLLAIRERMIAYAELTPSSSYDKQLRCLSSRCMKAAAKRAVAALSE